ncbi:MAG: AraC family transcriptional regulator [Asticcacaulis sp.]
MIEALAPATAAVMVMTALLVWQGRALFGQRAFAVSMCVGALYFLYAAYPQALKFLFPVLLAGPLVCNYAARAGFDIGQRPVWLDVALLAGLVGAGSLGFWPLQLSWAQVIAHLLSLYLFLELPLLVWRGLPDDLLRGRRMARFVVLGFGAILCSTIAIGMFFRWGWIMPVGAGLTMIMCFAAVGFDHEWRRKVAADEAPLDARGKALLTRLRHEMAEVYSDPQLSLSRLAQRLEVPEHHLRRVIHVGEGYGHFSAYLNYYRIEAFKARADEEATILELALSVGYNSLSAFNRAFKATEGVTPSAFRAARTAKKTDTQVDTPTMPKGT